MMRDTFRRWLPAFPDRTFSFVSHRGAPLTNDLRDRLQATLGSAYTLERELGGGGMSRVFVAEERALNRKVVVKVLPPDLAAGVSVDRFKREIQVAAGLHHPHIVPVLTAGETDGLPYYTMPFVEGESLRARLARGPLDVTEAIGVLRDVAKALAFAHEHGVVHRDIKPDNVMLTGGSATVTDFGIAKAISAARGGDTPGATLTQMGTSIGTPTYMSPEQAAGDPDTNHRTDIYSFGVMAYELLAGRPPFHSLPPQKLLAAHMAERPAPISGIRVDTPAPLAELVARCLEKDADNRPQSAQGLAQVLESTTSGGGRDAMPAALLGGRGMLRKALLIYAGAFVAVAVIARAAIVGIGLPDWVLPGALVVMGLGLPAILFTAYVHKSARRIVTQTPTLTPGGSPVPHGTMATIALKAAPHVTWRRTTLGGVYGLAAFVALIGVWMVMRAAGIGPAASLITAGKLGAKERVILGEFKSADSTLGQTVTEAFRTDLSQSSSLTIMPASVVREVLQRMQKPAGTRVDFAIAREVANREGMKAVIDGDVIELGGSYKLTARLIAAQSGEELATLSETAAEAKDIIPAISRLTKQLRSKIGESLKAVQNAKSLEKVTTPSMEALQKYVAALRALDIDGDFTKTQSLLEEAIALDTGFAMAYRKLGIELNNRGLSRARANELLQKAYDHRDRLSDAERYLAVGSYFGNGPKPDDDKAIAAYESLLELDPDNVTALNNVALRYERRREFAKAEKALAHAVEVRPTGAIYYLNLADVQQTLGKVREAEATVTLGIKNLPRNPGLQFARARIADAKGELDAALGIVDSVAKARTNDVNVRRVAWGFASNTAFKRGQVGDALRHSAELRRSMAAAGNRQALLNAMLDSAEAAVWFLSDRDRAARILERALVAQPLDSIELMSRPYARLNDLYSLTGQPARAKVMLQATDKQAGDDDPTQVAFGRHWMEGNVAMAESRYADAIREYRASDGGACLVCALPDIARAYDLAGNADSAIAVFARYVSHPQRDPGVDARYLPGAHKRLGELYEAKGDREKAMSHYATFIELWKNADAELQPVVKQARDRLARLQKAEKR